jgi:hypothetical protein
MQKAGRGDLLARLIGILVFALGIAIIMWVLWLAYQMFQDPSLGAPEKLNPKADPSAYQVGMSFGRLIVRILLLCLGSYSGSLIAHKGVFLYFSGLQGAPAVTFDKPQMEKPNVTPAPSPAPSAPSE